MLHPDDRSGLCGLAGIGGEWNAYEQEGRTAELTDLPWFLSRAVPLRDAEGRIVRWYGTNTDIEDRKRAEEELKREKEILAKIFNNIPVMIGFVSAEGGVKLVNREWERAIGWTLKELRDQNVDIFAEAYPDLSYRQKVLDFVAAATGESADLKIKVRAGHVIDAACAVVRLSDGTKVAIAQDITDRKRAAEALGAANHQLRILSRQLFHIQEEERRHLARELHDEIGQTLTAAKINLKIIEPDVPAKVAGGSMTASSFSIACHSVRELSLDLRPPLLDALGLVPTLRWLVDHQAQRAGLRVILTQLGWTGDRARVQHLFRVAQEPYQHHPAFGREECRRRATHELERLTLSVRDDGAGFEPAVIQQRTARDFTLGLVSMKERALLVRGGVEVHSAPGQGTEIRAWFPLAPGEPPSTEIA